MGLNNNNITAKPEPMTGPVDSPASSPQQARSYHTSPGSPMHLDGDSGQHAQTSPADSPLKDSSSAESADLETSSAKISPASADEPQAEDLSNKSSRGGSPISQQKSAVASAVASAVSAASQRYHPYSHSEIMIKSE